MEKVTFTPELHSLQDLSAIVIAKILWEKPDVVAKINTYFENYDKQMMYVIQGYDMDEPWHVIIENVKDFVKEFHLPNSVFQKITKMVIFVGYKVFYWKKYVVKELLPFDTNLIKKVYWTSLGTVDEGKVFQELWCKSNFENDFYKYVMACIFYQIDFIKENAVNMVDFIVDLYEVHELDVRELFTLLHNQFTIFEIIGIHFSLFHKGYDNYQRGFKLFLDTIKTEFAAREFFFMCLPDGLIKVAKYFYSEMKKEDQEKNLLQAAEYLLKIDQNFPFFRYRKEKHVELFLFVINNMPDKQKQIDFLSGNIISVCDLFITVWPYQKLLVPIFNSAWKSLTQTTKHNLVNHLLKFFYKYSNTWYNQNKEIGQLLLLNVLGKMKPEFKSSVIINNKNVLNLLKIKDFWTLNLILNDKHLKFYKNEIIKDFDPVLKEAAEKNDTETLNLYFEGLDLLDEEKVQLKSKYI